MAFHIEVLSPLFSTVAVECFIVGTTVVKNFIPFIVRTSAQRHIALYLMSIEMGHTLLFEGNVTSVLGLLVVFPAMASGFGPQIFCDGAIVNYFIFKSTSQTSS